MNKFFVRSLILFFALAKSALAVEQSQPTPTIASELEGWPWFQATILGDLAKPADNRAIVMDLPGSQSGTSLKVRIWRALDSTLDSGGESKGLFLIIPGTGGNSSSAMSNSIAANLSELGYDSLILTNPFSPEFQSTFSSDGLIGIPQKDMIDTNRMFEAALRFYSTQYPTPKSISLIGSSLGGLFSAMEGSVPSSIHFEKLISLNPPIHLQFSLDQVDDAIRTTLPNQFSWFDAYADLFSAFFKSKHGVTLQNMESVKASLPADEKTGLQEIGKSFQDTIIQVTRGLYNTATIFSSEERQALVESEINLLTFERYMGFVEIAASAKGIYPNISFDSLINEVSLPEVIARANDPSKIFVITNRDDFIIQESFLSEISPILGSRLQVFDAGGHCGNYWPRHCPGRIQNSELFLRSCQVI